eukprot:g41587.t1
MEGSLQVVEFCCKMLPLPLFVVEILGLKDAADRASDGEKVIEEAAEDGWASDTILRNSCTDVLNKVLMSGEAMVESNEHVIVDQELLDSTANNSFHYYAGD